MKLCEPVKQAFKEVIKPGSKDGILEWISKNVKVVDSPHGATYDPDQTPWYKEPLLELSDNSNDEIVIVAPVGSGKSAFFEAAIQWSTCEAPGGTQVSMQTDKHAEDFYQDRLEKAMKLCEPLKPLWPKDRHKIKKDSVNFSHMSFYIGGANLSNLQSKSMRWVYGDEVWLWKPGMMDEARGRTHDRWNARKVFVSQGSDEDTDFHLAWKETDQRIFHWQCEECGEWNKWAQAHMKYEVIKDENDDYNWDAIQQSVHMECPHCQAKYKDTPNARRKLSINSKYIPTNPKAQAGKIGFSVSDYAVFFKPWSLNVIRWIKANDQKKKGNIHMLRAFIQKRLAQFWKADYGENRSALLSADYMKSDYADGQLWESEVSRIMTIDVQRDHYWTSIRTWKADGTSRLLYESKVLTVETLREIQLKYKVQDRLTFIDAQYETGKVYNYCVEYDWTALHGDKASGYPHKQRGGGMVRKFYSPVKQAQAPNGGRARYIFWSNEKIKDQLIILRSGNGMDWEIPKDVSEEYKKQIDSEVKKDIVQKDGSMIKRWERIKKDNHLWDTEAMSVAAAMMLGVIATPEEPIS